MYSTELEINIKDFFAELGYDYTKMEINKPYDVSSKNYEILTQDGKWNRVINLIRKPDTKMYIITYENKSLEVADEHKILCRNINDLSEGFLETRFLCENNNYRKRLIDACSEFNFSHHDKTKIVSILERKLNYNPNIRFIDIYPDHSNYKLFFTNSFSLDPRKSRYVMTAGYRQTLEVFKKLEWS